MFRLLIERPRRALLVALVALTMVVGVRVVSNVFDSGPPRNDQAALDELLAQFPQSAWEPSLVSAYWSGPGDLSVSLDSDDRQLAMAACADLTEVIQVRTSTGPGDVTYAIHYSDGTLFIKNQSNDIIMVSNLSNNAGCQWRLD
jgi:hypothetical protein